MEERYGKERANLKLINLMYRDYSNMDKLQQQKFIFPLFKKKQRIYIPEPEIYTIYK